MSIAIDAEKLIKGDRREDYGPMKESFENIARIWNTILIARCKGNKLVLTWEDVGLMMAGLKLVREAHKHKKDNLVDFCGYAICLDEMHNEKGNE